MVLADDLKCVELKTRRDVYLRVSKIAAVLALKSEGPTRIMFDAGGSVDICGSAEIWRLRIRIVELGGEVDYDKTEAR